MEGRQLRDRDAILIDLVGVAGLMAFVAGLVLLQDSKQLGFDPSAALDGVLGQLSITLPAAILVLGTTFLELAAGLVLVRLLRRNPFDSAAEAVVGAFVAVIIKDTFLLGTLAAFGQFRSPVLIAIDVAIVAAGMWLRPISSWARPFLDIDWRALPGGIGSLTVAALVGVVWAGPIILQLASPVVPFVDVLPNYVGPVEHLRTFGWFSPLSATQSPIIGPSRTVLGYDAFMGSLATMTNQSGALAIAGTILPQTVLVAAGVHRLAGALGARGTAIGPWALLAFALSQSFARLADARGTVVVVPLVCFGLAIAADALRDTGDAASDRAGGSWRFGRGPIIGLALGAATLVHPVIGFFAILSVAVATLIRPRKLAADVFVAGLTAGLIAIPQLATMIGMSLPTLALGVALPLALVIGLVVARAIDRSEPSRATLTRIAEFARLIIPVAVILGFVAALAIGPLELDRLPDGLGEGLSVVLESSGLLLVVLVIGAALGTPVARSPIVVAGLGVGAAALIVTGVLPNNLGFLGDALRFEVPKTVHYWLSTIAAVGAAAALAYAWNHPKLPIAARGAFIAAFVVVAALPIRFGNSGDGIDCAKEDCSVINAYHLGEHRYSETFAIDLKYAASGFWIGYPDSRTVVDEDRRIILSAFRIEIEEGRLRHDTPVLHVASTFQQWAATPLGVFAGLDETSVSLQPEVSHQTVGGRLYGFDDLPGLLASKQYGYLLLEPQGLPDADATRAEIEAAGYVEIFTNPQGTVFRLSA